MRQKIKTLKWKINLYYIKCCKFTKNDIKIQVLGILGTTNMVKNNDKISMFTVVME